jgi:hypothetical protein
MGSPLEKIRAGDQCWISSLKGLGHQIDWAIVNM